MSLVNMIEYCWVYASQIILFAEPSARNKELNKLFTSSVKSYYMRTQNLFYNYIFILLILWVWRRKVLPGRFSIQSKRKKLYFFLNFWIAMHLEKKMLTYVIWHSSEKILKVCMYRVNIWFICEFHYNLLFYNVICDEHHLYSVNIFLSKRNVSNDLLHDVQKIFKMLWIILPKIKK